MSTEKKKNVIAGVLVALALLLVGWRWVNYSVMQGRGAVARQVSGAQILASADPATREQIVSSAAEQMLRSMVGSLNLSSEQQQQIRGIQQNAVAQGRAIGEDKNLTDEQKREKTRTLRDDMFNRINGVLTPQQQAQFAPMRERIQGAMRRMGG